jgi:shikimate dehydrogenase
VLADREGWPKALLDVVYADWPTQLGRAAAAGGCTVVGGLPMLVHQAARQVELMTGQPAPVEAMRLAAGRNSGS